MLIWMPFSNSNPVKASLVNCTPWSVLKISGAPNSRAQDKRVYAKVGIKAVAQAPAQYITAEPINYSNKICKALKQPDVGDVSAPDLVGPGYLKSF